MEFLVTYGWAFLVVLVMVGALAYFGVLNPQNLVSDRCTSPPGFSCIDYQVNSGSTTLKLRNMQGQTINVAGSLLFSKSDATSVECTGASNVLDGAEFTLYCSGIMYNYQTNSFVSGEKIKADIGVTYYKTMSGSSYSKTVQTSLVSTYSNS